jgi:predicted Zn finger-like uncharacterized protein
MRLTCPNCKAQYEVADRVIPDGGRDVQCSSCGNTWFQYPAEVALQMRVADLDDDDDEDDAAPRPAAVATGERRIDRTVLDVLRQEADRELAERRKAQPRVETQPELGLVSRPRPRPPGAEDEPEVAPVRPAGDPARAASRRNLLPDIEELTSTLEPSRHARPGDAADDPPQVQAEVQRGRDFRRGLSAVLLACTVLLVLYVLAPTISAAVPVLSGPLAGYVVMIDTLRQMLAGLLGG